MGGRRGSTRGVPAALVSAARERRSLTLGHLAGRLGVSRLTLRGLELGTDSRLSTLSGILRELDDLAPPDLLGGEGRAPRDLTPLGELDTRLLGARADSVAREVRLLGPGTAAITTSVTGIRTEEALPPEPAVLADLLRLVLLPEGGLRSSALGLAREILSAGRVEARDSRSAHEITLKRGARWELDLRVSEPARHVACALERALAPGDCLAIGSGWLVQVPVRRCRITLRLPEGQHGASPVAFAWVEPLLPEPADDRAARQALAFGVRVAAGREGELTASLAHPPSGLHLALGWELAPPARTSVRARASARAKLPPAALSLRRAREAAGLSIRALAARMGVGAMTVSDAESGTNPRGSTLRALVEALPELSAWDLFAPESLSPAQAWAFRRDLIGCEVDAESKLVDIDAKGDAAMRIETRALRLLSPRPGPVRLHVGFSAPTMTLSRARLRSVSTSGDDAESLRIAAMTGPGGEKLYQLTIPERLARHGVSFTRVLVHPAIYALTPEEAQRRTGQPGPFHEGTSFAVSLPVRRLRLIVRFPKGAFPGHFTAHVWPVNQAPDPSVSGLGAWLHPHGMSLETRQRSRKIVLTVEQPMIGVKYGLAWRLGA